MKFTKSWKRFWTMNRNHAGGFTLVELIVVIAILAILAGIAIPAYSGYINKANEAGDMTLLSAVNTAFAAACMDNEIAATSLADGSVRITSYGPGIAVSEYNEEFQYYFAGNESAKFEVITNLAFKGGVFVPDDMIVRDFKGGSFTASSSDIANVSGSALGSIGADGLTGQLSSLAGWANANNLAGMGGQGFANAMMGYLGFETQDEYMDYMKGLKGDEADKMTANALVLYAAQNSNNLTTDTISGLLDDGNLVENLTNSANADALAQAGAIYGLYMAYDQNNTTSEDLDWDNPTAVLGAAAGDPDFQSWVNGADGKSELNAYMSAMNIISGNAQNSDTATSILQSGYSDTDLVNLMKDLLGEN